MTTLVIEDVSAFAKVIMEMYQYIGEEDYIRLFDDQYKVLKKTELSIVGEIFTFDINSKANLKLVYQDLEEQLNERPDVKNEIEILSDRIAEIVNGELLEHDLDLAQDEITIQELYISLGIKIETNSKTAYEKILDIIQLYKYLKKQKLLVFVNSLSFLTNEEIEEVRTYIKMQNKPVLFIEPRRISGQMQYILDGDFYLEES